jgi:TRAP-type uncharacterized transport system fused permease subunit
MLAFCVGALPLPDARHTAAAMRMLRWMFTTEGSAATPLLSAALGALLVGVVSGTYFWFRTSPGWGIAAGLTCAAVFFFTLYQQLRDEHAKHETVDHSVDATVSRRERLASARHSLVRLAILFAALPVGVVLAVAIGSAWGLVITIACALVVLAVWKSAQDRHP